MTDCLRYIFHLSDLHIRNGDKYQSRYDEYKKVFENTIESIKNKINELSMKSDDYLIIITGDIFHNKNVIGNYGLLLYRNFIELLTKIGKVIIIQGNHDYQQAELNQPSLVFSSTFQIDNLIILDKTTSFILNDCSGNKIGFSYVSVDDTLDVYKNSGRIQELPEFPKLTGDDIKYRIGLFHGTFAKVKLYNGDEIREDTNPYPLEWIKDLNLDFMLLGDIHKRQLFNYKQTLCGYSGSLIQQNYGEDILDHGYLLWDLENKKAKEINVYNEIGYINIKEVANDEILIRQNGKYEKKLEDVIIKYVEQFPKNIEIKTFSKINFNNLNNLLKKYKIKFTIISKINDTNNEDEIKEHIADDIGNEISTMNNDDYILSYFKKMLTPSKYSLLSSIIKDKDVLLFDTSKYPEELLNECIKKNKELSVIIKSCNQNDEITVNKPSFLIRYLEWEGLLCYEDKNWLNMSELDSKTFLIKGRNGTGKSAIYDILLLAIWGKNGKSDGMSGGIINHKKEKAYTSVDIEINGTIYRISRSFERRKNDKSNGINNYSSALYKFEEDNVLEVYKKDSSCNSEVEKLVGTRNSFLFSSMITQNVDNDILELESAKCLELIDKYSNVEYLHNLNTLFKTASNKYKDLKRTIENKKQVYEKLLSTNKIEEINEKEIIETNELLITLMNKKEGLLIKFDSIIFDIKNPKTLIILDIDYEELINKLKYKIISDDEYKKLFENYNELKYILKDIDETKLKEIQKEYTESLESKLNDIIITNKPCDVSLLDDEEKFLKSYLNEYKYDGNDNESLCEVNIEKIEKELKELKIEKENYEKTKNELIENKPENVDKCLITKEECIQEILKYYKSVDDLYNYIKNNNKKSDVISLEYSNSNGDIIYDEYIINIKKINDLKSLIEIDNKKLLKLEDEFKKCFKKQQEIQTLNKPIISINYKTTNTIKRTMNTIKIKDILKKIEEDDKRLIEYYKLEELKTNLEKELLCYKQEQLLLNTNEDYKYNPKCEYCCKRPWVCRIKEINILCDKIENDINTVNDNIKNNNYILILNENENNKKQREKYNLLSEWYEYYKNKETNDKITKELNEIVKTKEVITNNLLKLKDDINHMNINNDIFNIKSYELYNKLINIEKYDRWDEWDKTYNILIKEQENVITKISKLEKENNYNVNIKPRIKKYYKLRELYNDWERENKIKTIINVNQLLNYKNLIETYEKYKEYKNNEKSKELIREKLLLNDEIKELDKQIKIINESNIKRTTINSYNKENKDSYIKLCDVNDEIDMTIDTLETIVINFLAFKIELYDKHILNKLRDRTNIIIKSLCHKDTKPFKVNYHLSVSKEIIHINWLISNEEMINDVCNKKLISISHASGFQHFAISLALRMSLFNNKNEIMCNQLFIDEGFVNFDKYNLSIVPKFLKTLLSYFSSIILVSHIDLIQDNIDETVDIKYDKTTLISQMHYNNRKTTITKRTRK